MTGVQTCALPISGYTIANDITAREMQRADQAKGRPWTLSKGMDTFCPLGPYLVPADALQEPHNLEMKLTVNGKVRQSGNTGAMVFQIPALIAHISKYMTLEPGDVLLTGTPEGVAPIVPGDTVACTIDGLGTLLHSVVQAA